MSLVGILIFMIVSAVLLLIVLFLSYILSPGVDRIGDSHESYECGNLPFSDARLLYPVRFYFVALLFLLFEVEAALLIPWALIVRKVNAGGVLTGLLFLFFLLVPFLFAWKEGILRWLEPEEM